jgi:diguanylate cyclase (GGDEF)-like protein/PAS domain S-box-containing protein
MTDENLPPALPKLLIVDDQAINIQTLYQIFSEDYQVFKATSGQKALDLCATQAPDLILLDVMMPDMDGHEVCRRLKANALTQDIPVIFTTAQNSPDDEAAGLALGAVDFITKPINAAVIKARVRTHILLRQTLCHEKDLWRQLVDVLSKAEAANQELVSLLKFNETIILTSPLAMGVYADTGECIIANEAFAQLVGATREALMAQNFRQIESWKNSGLLDAALTALNYGSMQRCEIQLTTSFGKALWAECQILPVVLNNQNHLLIQFTDLTEHKDLEIELRRHAFHDALTQLPNRRLLLDRLTQALHSAKRHGKTLAVLFLDLNRFKQLNDTHGHEAGDLLLIEVARRLLSKVRECDTVARLGGDEFVVLLENLDADTEVANTHVAQITSKIRLALSEEYVFGEIRHHSSASIGIKLIDKGNGEPEDILKAADAAMYAAKKSGSAS